VRALQSCVLFFDRALISTPANKRLTAAFDQARELSMWSAGCEAVQFDVASKPQPPLPPSAVKFTPLARHDVCAGPAFAATMNCCGPIALVVARIAVVKR
jgi:hypothetical protein